MTLTALVTEVYQNQLVRLGVQLFTFDYTITGPWIRSIRPTQWEPLIDFPPDELTICLAEFLADNGAEPATIVSVDGWQRYLKPDTYLRFDARWLQVQYGPRGADIEDHLDAIQDEINAERYLWKNLP